MSFRNPLRLVSRRFRRQRIESLLLELQEWEVQGRDILAQLVELTEPDDDLHCECARVLELLDGP